MDDALCIYCSKLWRRELHFALPVSSSLRQSTSCIFLFRLFRTPDFQRWSLFPFSLFRFEVEDLHLFFYLALAAACRLPSMERLVSAIDLMGSILCFTDVQQELGQKKEKG
jgi:hypothetical protein